MTITHFSPRHPSLQPLIAGVYLLERTKKEAAEQYLAFAGTNHFITIQRSAICSVNNHEISVKYKKGADPSAFLVSNFERPHQWRYEGPAEEWNICFKPLGINHFMDVAPGMLSHNTLADFNSFNDFIPHITNLYTLTSHEEKLAFIETYWLSKLKSFSHPFLPILIKRILDNEVSNFTESAKELNISRPAMHHAFKRYVGTSPAKLEKIHRFRTALTAYRENPSTLTHVSGEASYFDQSHMIRDFKSFTGFTPKDFYKSIAAFPKGGINWIFTA